MSKTKFHVIPGKENSTRLASRILEDRIQAAVSRGHRHIEVQAMGQHGIGGRLWKAGDDPLFIRVSGHSGQRLGSLGFPHTRIEAMGPASDDVGWLNAGAEIVVHGNAANGIANGMSQGKVFIGGNIGARGMTMTKHNPRFAPPELWVLGSVGDYFGEFMAGGVAVICGVEPQDPANVLGYRPFVGMVGGKVFFRGPHQGFSQADARMMPISDEEWGWLAENLESFAGRIKRPEVLKPLSDRRQWQLLVARTPQERLGLTSRSMASFHKEIWDRELGPGGLVGDLTDIDRSTIPVITSSDLRRYLPVWENRKYKAPCEATCPTGIPVQQRWQLIREGRMDEAVDLALTYTPFPATVCGYLCPNLCMSACTRQSAAMFPVDIRHLGKASIDAKLPPLPPLSGKRIAVVGGGPAGLSVAWQLRRYGHEAVVYDRSEKLGGKIANVIPDSRIPQDVVTHELERIAEVIPHVNLQQNLTRDETERLRADFDFMVIAAGAQKPRSLPIPGSERLVTALDFLRESKAGRFTPGKRVVIIGAGNVGCDAATEAHRLGARQITLLDVQQPASFGKEREAAEAAGAEFRWPVFTKEITAKGVKLNTGEVIPADTVIISIGDVPDLEFLPRDIVTERGFVTVNDHMQTSDPKIFAIGDAVKPGLLTDAIGAGRKAAAAINDILNGKRPLADSRAMIDRRRVHLEYFDPRVTAFEDMAHCGSQCSSCGACRDCGLCVAICPQAAISRRDLGAPEYEYVVDADLCIGCGFCAGACPCGIWDLVENDPLG